MEEALEELDFHMAQRIRMHSMGDKARVGYCKQIECILYARPLRETSKRCLGFGPGQLVRRQWQLQSHMGVCGDLALLCGV